MLLIVPGTGVMGEGEQIGVFLPAPALTMVRLAWVKLLPLTAPQLQVERALDSQRRGNTWVQNGAQGGAQSTRDSQLIAMLQMPGLGSHGKEMCHSCQNIKPGWGDPRECSQTSLQQQSVSLQHSLSGPKPKPTQVKAVNKKG